MPYDYHDMNMASLVDLLAQKTEKITQLLVEKRFNEEYESCKEDIKQIQAAIAYRKEFFLQDP